MRILTLPVDDYVADSYNNASQKEKKKINSAINLLLGKILQAEQNNALILAMDKLAVESSRTGLAVDKLAELMDWDEDIIKNLFGEEHRDAC